MLYPQLNDINSAETPYFGCTEKTVNTILNNYIKPSLN